MFPIKRTVFFTSVTVHKNTVRLIRNIEYTVFTTADPTTVIFDDCIDDAGRIGRLFPHN